jgi:hypothetical protein
LKENIYNSYIYVAPANPSHPKPGKSEKNNIKQTKLKINKN